MERICIVLQVKPDRIEEYKKRHRNVWPEMLEAIHESGWHNYSLFLSPGGMLVGYFEAENREKALALLAQKEVNLRWQREMADFFVQLEGPPDESFLQLEQVFYTA